MSVKRNPININKVTDRENTYMCSMEEESKNMVEFKKYRILVIDDNTAIHDDFRKILQRFDTSKNNLSDMEFALFGSKTENTASTVFDIDCASQGKDGLEMALKAKSEGHPYAMAFVDGRMPPGWDGIETINQIWKEYPEMQVVLCTAYADYSWKEIRDVLGESDSLLILKKPFDNIEVLQLAHALTRKWELNREVKHRIDNLDDLVQLRTEEKDRAKMLLEAALKHSPSGIIISNDDGSKILWANQAAREIYGDCLFPPAGNNGGEEKTGFYAVKPDETPLKNEELPFYRAVSNEEIIYNEEILLKNNDGKNKWVSYNAAPILDQSNGKVAGIAIINDISDRKKTEIEHGKLQEKLVQIQKMDSVGLLAGGVAHDYNNIMSVIMGNVEMGLLSTDPADPIFETLEEIKKAAQRSTDLTQQLLAFARKQTITPKILDLNGKISDMLNILRRLIGEDIDLVWNPETYLWKVKVDPSQIDQIIINLCVNSRDAINGVGKITIKTSNITFSEADTASRPGLKPGEYAGIAVTDNGHGMTKKVINRIFEPFYTTKEFGKGTGLGLATVYGIVKQNAGFLNVESEPEKGSTFTVYLPRFKGTLKIPVPERHEVTNCGKGEKILMVEDTDDVLAIGKAMLEKLGYSVLSANTPGEALKLAENSNVKIDLLITDVIMPGINGSDLAKKLQSQYPELKCLFMSGYTADIIAKRGVLDEGVQLMQKPFTFTELASKIRAVLYEGTDK